MTCQLSGHPGTRQARAPKIMEFSTPRDPSGRPCLPTHHGWSHPILTNSAGIRGTHPQTCRACWNGWLRCLTRVVRAECDTPWSSCSRSPLRSTGRGEVTAGGRRVDRRRPATGAASCRRVSRSAASPAAATSGTDGPPTADEDRRRRPGSSRGSLARRPPRPHHARTARGGGSGRQACAERPRPKAGRFSWLLRACAKLGIKLVHSAPSMPCRLVRHR